MLRTSSVLVTVALAMVALTACNGDDDAAAPGDATTSIQVTGTDGLDFEPSAFTVPAGEQVTVELTSEPGVEHDFAIEDVDGQDLDVAHADPGETATGTFTIDDAGTYEFYCAVPGHREAGMDGTLEVVD